MNLSSDTTTPYTLHTRHLTSQQTLCARNPTYTQNLTVLHTLREQVEQVRGMLLACRKARDAASVSAPTADGGGRCKLVKSRDKADAGSVEELEAEVRELEKRLADWDDEVAGLAEGLTGRPKFRVEDEVKFIDGRWWWALPDGKNCLPRQLRASSEYAFTEIEKVPMIEWVKRRLWKLWQRASSGRKLAKRTSTGSTVF
ncbi:hypothetical protein BDY17DRAFT_326744 [Neohortaea acidophila]|uniref:Uncharacterized protein n=1 Tax=Neohortaea acidophila TaxID=245834 RepID=A0A6A6PLC0_9PEZI|nr:uncharacterized protein BDY17DRAFT_326744 [Neohortaea acidophila]KAF2480870.1 hypothetical protein BDY17DRAFT_326744 [Neohortaea acidophila]